MIDQIRTAWSAIEWNTIDVIGLACIVLFFYFLFQAKWLESILIACIYILLIGLKSNDMKKKRRNSNDE